MILGPIWPRPRGLHRFISICNSKEDIFAILKIVFKTSSLGRYTQCMYVRFHTGAVMGGITTHRIQLHNIRD